MPEWSGSIQLLDIPESFLMRPVLRGFLSFESLFDSSVSLGDLVLLNDAIDANDENERRVYQYYERKNGRN